MNEVPQEVPANGAMDAQPPIRDTDGEDSQDWHRRRESYYHGGGGDDRPRSPSHSWVASLTIIAVVLAAFVSGAAIITLFIEPLERRLDDYAANSLERDTGHSEIERENRGEMARDLEGLENDIEKLEADVLGETRALWLAVVSRVDVAELSRRISVLEAARARRVDSNSAN